MHLCFYFNANVHDNDKQFECVTCSSRFVTQLELINHESSVHGGKTYKCGQGFAWKVSIVDSHVVNIAYACKCGKTYTYACMCGKI